MPTGFIDPATVHTPAPDTEPPPAWGQVVNHDLGFLAASPAASVSGAVQTVASGSDTVLTATELRYDDPAEPLWDPGQPDRLTVTQPGLYTVFAAVHVDAFGGDNSERLVTDFIVNAATVVPADVRVLQPIPVTTRLSVLRVLTLAEGDFVRVRVNHNAGGAPSFTLSEFALAWKRSTPP